MYIVCPVRKGNPKIHIQVCKRCTEKCPEKKKLPRIRIPKRFDPKTNKVSTPQERDMCLDKESK